MLFRSVHFPFGLFKDARVNRYQGWTGGIGFTYGYAWKLGCNWSLEPQIAVGYMYSKFDKYRCADCGEKLGRNSYNYVGPTKIALNIVYLFGGRDNCKSPKEQRAEREAYERQLAMENALRAEYEQQLADQAAAYAQLQKECEEERERVAREIRAEIAKNKKKKRVEELQLNFKVNQIVILDTLDKNSVGIARITAMIDELNSDKDVKVKKLTITGYASVEGPFSRNVNLAAGRAEA